MRFSIITPSYRSGRWLKLCIPSVADQEGVDFEHIVQDSCSDDETREWLPGDPRVTAVIEKDSGMYDAVNRGFRRATGEILSYLNCDEQYLSGALAKVARYFDGRPEVDALLADCIVIDPKGDYICERRAGSAAFPYPGRYDFKLSHGGVVSEAARGRGFQALLRYPLARSWRRGVDPPRHLRGRPLRDSPRVYQYLHRYGRKHEPSAQCPARNRCLAPPRPMGAGRGAALGGPLPGCAACWRASTGASPTTTPSTPRKARTIGNGSMWQTRRFAGGGEVLLKWWRRWTPGAGAGSSLEGQNGPGSAPRSSLRSMGAIIPRWPAIGLARSRTPDI